MDGHARTTGRGAPFPSNREQYCRREDGENNPIPHVVMMRRDSRPVNSASNEPMPNQTQTPKQGTVRKATAADLEVGQICADRDGNRIRIDHVDGAQLSYHFLNDELRVQEGIQECSIERFLSEGWYISNGAPL
jgi:hypothetical protein